MSVTPAAVTATLLALQASVKAAGTLQGASDATLAPVVNAALAATAAIESGIATVDALIGAGVGLASGTDALQAVAWINSQRAAIETQVNLLTIRAYVARIELNLAARL